MYCSKNVINRALNLPDHCDDEVEEVIDCISCTCYCIDKKQLIEKVYFIINNRSDIGSKQVQKINGYIKQLD